MIFFPLISNGSFQLTSWPLTWDNSTNNSDQCSLLDVNSLNLMFWYICPKNQQFQRNAEPTGITSAIRMMNVAQKCVTWKSIGSMVFVSQQNQLLSTIALASGVIIAQTLLIAVVDIVIKDPNPLGYMVFVVVVKFVALKKQQMVNVNWIKCWFDILIILVISNFFITRTKLSENLGQ